MDLREAKRLQKAGKLAEAEAEARKTVEAHPFSAPACHLLGLLLCQRGSAADGIELVRRAAALAPAVAETRLNLGALLAGNGRPTEALPHLIEAARMGGPAAETQNNLGACLDLLGRGTEALPLLRNAVHLKPDYAHAHHNLATALRHLGRMAEAAESFRRAVRLHPHYEKAAFGLAQTAGELGDAHEVVTFFRRILQTRPELCGIRSAVLYTLHYLPDYDAEALFREHVQWGRMYCDPVGKQLPAHANDHAPDRRLRIAYVSPDLREHTVTKFITAALQYHDPDGFEVFCYSDVEKPDQISRKIEGMVEHWRQTRQLKSPELEQLIRQDRIDILVDLRGHAADNRLTLFAHKPAPVQVNMVGYFNTTGLSAMDYRLTDGHQDPPGMTERYHSEKLIRIEPSCWCYTPAEDSPDVVEPPALKNGYVTFGSLNKIAKVSEPCARIWARVLEAVPNSRLLLSATGDAASVVRGRLARMGLPLDRVDILGKAATTREYLGRFGRIDITLDTFPFNGITTTCDGLWMGVPCVSLSGATSVSRAGKSILHASNLPELCADRSEQFIQIATELAGDLDRLRDLRLSMRDRLLSSPLLDQQGFARKLESEYRRIWRHWCESGERA